MLLMPLNKAVAMNALRQDANASESSERGANFVGGENG
jgi:hypothetical protein